MLLTRRCAVLVVCVGVALTLGVAALFAASEHAPPPGGSYFPGAREHAVLLRESILDPEQGAIEAWYRQASDPVPYKHNPHRIFGGPYSLTGVDEVNLFSQDRLDSGEPRLHFTVFFGDEPPPWHRGPRGGGALVGRRPSRAIRSRR